MKQVRRLACPERYSASGIELGAVETAGMTVAFRWVATGYREFGCLFANCGNDRLTQIVLVRLLGGSDAVQASCATLNEAMRAHLEEHDGRVVLKSLQRRDLPAKLVSAMRIGYDLGEAMIDVHCSDPRPFLMFRLRPSEGLSFLISLADAGTGDLESVAATCCPARDDDCLIVLGGHPDLFSARALERARDALAADACVSMPQTVSRITRIFARDHHGLIAVAARVRSPQD